MLASGGEIAVVFITDGENNPWPQRLLEKKLFLSKSDRAKWGTMRRREALCSLSRLGIAEQSAIFLAFPDQGIASLARRGDAALRDKLRETIERIRPTLIISPSTFDDHSDHRATAYYAHSAAPDASIATYVVHGCGPAERAVCKVELSEREQNKKFEAIECHESQLSLSRDRFLSYGRRNETFFRAEHDIVRVDSAVHERLINLRHALRVCFGTYPSGVQTAADVQDGAGDVPGLLGR